ncbi:sodium:solute symporter family protein [uncultured Ferrimonas sp.]|uniref:sodium:solute symporter family protein n=1 Tax=uncultured Ferrimonas sp. TaxID=432640 RepID=UPI00263867D7|nr:sodium:solute symporter family protein [uncultured Ferrimonas sp.]
MQLSWIDAAIVLAYLCATVIIGLMMKRRASKNLKSYFQGGKQMPWYLLGLSNASGMFDISGTMWLVSLCFLYGMKSIWIPWLWPVFNQVFLMVYLSIWLRRSNVLTGAEWINTRFGLDRGATLSHLVVVAFALISVLGFLAYGFVGVGKFIEIFIPWSAVGPLLPFALPAQYVPHFYGVIFTSIATFYVVMGGMYSIVWTDVLQFSIMTVAALTIGVIAMMSVSPAQLQAAVPAGWADPLFGWDLDIDWQNLIPAAVDKVGQDGYSLFGLLVMMMLFKGVLVSAAGPAPNYDMQKILATKSPREGALMSGFVSVALMPIRYFLIAGFAVLAVVYFDRLDLVRGDRIDFENILPTAMLEFVPTGLLGLLLAGLLAAFMSTFASTVNAAPAYLVNDIYRRYFRPDASDRTLIRASYLVSVLVVLISTGIGLFVSSINSVLQWLVSGLWGGYTVANVLKWYWWRLNGHGYFWSMASGIGASLLLPPLVLALGLDSIMPWLGSDLLPLYLFPLVLVISLLTAIVVSLNTAAVDNQTLQQFYRTVRPWGFWQPIAQQVESSSPNFPHNRNFGSDMSNVALGVLAQTCLVALPIFTVLQDFQRAGIALVLLLVSAVLLKRNWYDRLDSHEPTEATVSPISPTTVN